MLKYMVYFVVVIAVVGLLASGVHLYRVAMKNKKEMARYMGAPIPMTKNFGKVLVVYYSLSGNTKAIAEKIKAKTNADIYEIHTAEPLKTTPAFYFKVKQQIKNGNYPQLAEGVPDFSRYDMIFVGFPVWWYTIATPGLEFLKQADFGGKKVVPFSTQGSNYGSFFEDFARHAQNARLQQSASFDNLPEKYNDAVDNKISEWLNNL